MGDKERTERNANSIKKSVLLILPKYYGYEYYIRKGLQNKGWDVFVIYENIDNISLFYRIIMVYGRSGVKDYALYRYYKKRLEKIKGDIDLVLVIRGSTLSKGIMEAIENKWAGCRKVLYQWDSIINNKNALSVYRFFDRILTFDPDDAKKMGWDYRPLFYIEDLCNNTKKEYDLSAIFHLHSNRLKVLSVAKVLCERRGYTFWGYVFAFPLVYVRHKFLLRDSVYKQGGDIRIRFKPLSIEESNRVYDYSKAVLDYTHPMQSGYTMRTIEAIGHGCALLTNNRRITDADFYDSESVYIYDEENFDIPARLITIDGKRDRENIKRRYELSAWLDELIE